MKRRDCAILWFEELASLRIGSLRGDNELAWLDFVKLVPSVCICGSSLDFFSIDSASDHLNELCSCCITDLLLDIALYERVFNDKAISIVQNETMIFIEGHLEERDIQFVKLQS